MKDRWKYLLMASRTFDKHAKRNQGVDRSLPCITNVTPSPSSIHHGCMALNGMKKWRTCFGGAIPEVCAGVWALGSS